MKRLCFIALVVAVGCATPSQSSSTSHGQITELSRVAGPIALCSHRVPEATCALHHPNLVAEFKRAGDWCTPHGRPESQCLECHPDLTFDPLPVLGADADVAWLTRTGEDVPDLAAHAVPGKVTVFDFYADWCAACRKVTGHMYTRLAARDARVAYRKINVISWETAVAQRYLQKVPSLPLLVVYGPDGTKRRSLHGADLAALDQAISEASR